MRNQSIITIHYAIKGGVLDYQLFYLRLIVLYFVIEVKSINDLNGYF